MIDKYPISNDNKCGLGVIKKIMNNILKGHN
jgi:hypothetical protein